MKDVEDEEQLQGLIERLRRVKVYDGALVPEVSALLIGAERMAEGERAALINQIFQAAGEFRAAADLLRATPA